MNRNALTDDAPNPVPITLLSVANLEPWLGAHPQHAAWLTTPSVLPVGRQRG